MHGADDPRAMGEYLRNLTMDVTSLTPTNNGSLFNIYFDNGGTTPPLKSVVAETEEYTPWYKYVAANSLKAEFLTALYEQGRTTIKRFVGADMELDTAAYTKNTTEAINILSNVVRLRMGCERPVVITTYMEHMSNYLPWKFRFDTVLAGLTPDGRLSMADLERKLCQYRGRVALVAVTGASNVTGYVNPIHDIARLAHHYGAEIFVDAAQLVQHRNICMTPADPAERIDYLAFSAHKIYAPFFSGVLIGPRKVFDEALPLYFGAGMASSITEDDIVFKDGPARYEAGSQNLLGAIALCCALLTIERTGMHAIQKHESGLLAYGTELLSRIPAVIQYGDTNCLTDRVPIISFNVRGKTPEQTGAYLYDDYGIILKNGTCGANLYVEKLTQGSPYAGVVRISMALFNQRFELERLAEALEQYR